MEDKLQKHGNNTGISREMTILAYLRISFAGRYSEQLDTGSHSQTPASPGSAGPATLLIDDTQDDVLQPCLHP